MHTSTYNRRDRKDRRYSSTKTSFRRTPVRRGSHQNGRKLSTFDPSHFINTNPIEITEESYTPKHSFADFGLSTRLTKNIAALGIQTPTPIQDQTIPEILKGRDTLGIAETGTGKTAAFLIPLIEKTLKDRTRQTLILVPTRELALQIQEELQKLARAFGFFTTTCVGGVNIQPQIRTLRRPNHFVVGTPGRILDLINRRVFKPEHLTTVVLDEADRMLEMGFVNDMRTILSATPANRETLLFSATMTVAAKKIVNDFMNNPVTISTKKKDVANSIEQNIVSYTHEKKFTTLLSHLARAEFKRVLIFGAMKHSVNKLAIELARNNIKADSIHGNKNHVQRQRALKQFKIGTVRVLVATDVAARGIHIEDVTHVINYDLPNTFEDYIHRIGRTGRGSKRGKALTFVPVR